MTLKELADAIFALPESDRACPAASFVHVTGVARAADGRPVLSTGKAPPAVP